MIAIGADVHKRTCTLAMQGEDGQLTMLPSMENTRENWLHRLAKLPPQAEIALEVSTSGHFVMSVLEEAGWRERARSAASLVAASASFPEIARLQTIPGLGHILAAVIWSEIGDLRRFASADALVNYTGLVPSLYESGEVSHHGGITRQGPAWLRWALITAANAVTRSKSPLARRYWRPRRRQRPNVAKTAVAGPTARR